MHGLRVRTVGVAYHERFVLRFLGRAHDGAAREHREERGQALAIAENIEEMFNIKAPIVSIIIGEGGSGGALGIAVADKVFMMEYSIYSVISPESCASILCHLRI